MSKSADDGSELVRRLIHRQFPSWADRPVMRVEAAGVDNRMFRLGRDLVVRLPAQPSSVEPLKKEQVWVPRLAPYLPLSVPRLVGAGQPCDDFPWPWSVNTWIEGVPAEQGGIIDWTHLALKLAAFLDALHSIEASEGPSPGPHNFWRGIGLGARDRLTREAIAGLGEQIDGRAALAAWEADASASCWSGGPRWIHGDLHGQNLLHEEGRLCGVIDFGCLGVGDPACDIAAAWRLLPQEVRASFRDAAGVDDDTWRRGRAWALSISLRELCVYRGAAPRLETIAKRTLAEVLRDHGT
jgi:aminoglycoside phosphotransferase (APT) family kinase protein